MPEPTVWYPWWCYNHACCCSAIFCRERYKHYPSPDNNDGQIFKYILCFQSAVSWSLLEINYYFLFEHCATCMACFVFCIIFVDSHFFFFVKKPSLWFWEWYPVQFFTLFWSIMLDRWLFLWLRIPCYVTDQGCHIKMVAFHWVPKHLINYQCNSLCQFNSIIGHFKATLMES